MASKIELVYVESADGIPNNEAFYKAWEGFRKRGFTCELFTQADFADLPIRKKTLVAGGLRTVEAALTRLGLDLPTVDYLPMALSRFWGRQVWHTTWGELRTKYGKTGPTKPLFVKPNSLHKKFASIALWNLDDIQSVAHYPDSYEVLAQEYIVFESEWRCFVCHGQVVEMSHYQGDVFTYPDPEVIQQALTSLRPNAPAGFAIDFGVTSEGKTILVELGDGYSVGSYGMNAAEYSELLEARWLELVRLD